MTLTVLGYNYILQYSSKMDTDTVIKGNQITQYYCFLSLNKAFCRSSYPFIQL